jgi:hypothetical protein
MVRSQCECAICGAPNPDTRDHMPPRCIFPKPIPQDVITVPVCRGCNESISGEQERFKVYLSLHVGDRTPDTHRLLHHHARRTLKKNRKLARSVIGGFSPVLLATQQNIAYGIGYRRLWDSQAHDVVVERLVRGLHYHHTGQPLGPSVPVKTQWFRNLSPQLRAETETWQQRSIGGNQFVYRFGVATDDPRHSAWVFQFFGRHWAGGYSKPISASV